ncbi:MAG TPA: pantoate--beta-alanine ligase, partial [Thermovirgaceae bacterium]|nr:pantoate--beta-alanine ligase [Thermovirgaceae bacterium]
MDMPFIAGSPAEARKFLRENARSDRGVGLVPTMGFLHEGHLSLVRRAREENAICVVSIFVNPLQFGPSEDLGAYPRDMKRDLGLLSGEGVDMVYAPSPEVMYLPDRSVLVTENSLSRCLCGAARPGHFDGVCTVVMKLFSAISPDRSYFGQKDYQQLQVIRRMARDLDLAVEIVGCPIIREPDGLAMSSRNIYLGEEERREALALSRSLDVAESMVNNGETSSELILRKVRSVIASSSMVILEYAEIRDAEDLSAVETIDGRAVCALAARVGRARLIDNR